MLNYIFFVMNVICIILSSISIVNFVFFSNLNLFCLDDYLSTECNENLLNCLAKLSEGSPTFEGNKCLMTEVIDVIAVVIEAAVLAGRVLHKP